MKGITKQKKVKEKYKEKLQILAYQLLSRHKNKDILIEFIVSPKWTSFRFKKSNIPKMYPLPFNTYQEVLHIHIIMCEWRSIYFMMCTYGWTCFPCWDHFISKWPCIWWWKWVQYNLVCEILYSVCSSTSKFSCVTAAPTTVSATLGCPPLFTFVFWTHLYSNICPDITFMSINFFWLCTGT